MTAPPSRVNQLRNWIIKAKQAYYYGGKPIMTDAEYDALEAELASLSPKDPLLDAVGAPVPPDAMLAKARHRIPMGSQNKVNSEAEFATWYHKSARGGAVHASLKGDGASAAAYYEAGRLVQVISRGDGTTGEDITANAVKFRNLPIVVNDPAGRPFSGAVRIEVILTVDDWGRVDAERATNPRNLGSGIMGRKSGEQAELLSAYAFDIDERANDASLPFARERDKTERLAQLGFAVIPHQVCEDLDAAVGYYRDTVEQRLALPFWIDGIVYKVDDVEQQLALGLTANRPKGQIAWKFTAEGAETVLRSYSVNVGHTGALIPCAQFDPVPIGGTNVKSALLNNWDEIERLDVAVGDRVWVIKANDIIPKVIEVRERPPDRQPIPRPAECPVCRSPVARRLISGGAEGAVIECTSDECPAKSIGKLKRWIRGLDIQGIGDSVRLALVRELGVEDASGLYHLHEAPDALAQLVINAEKELRLGGKRAQSILAEIEKKRQLTLVEFLGSLGLARLGQRRVQLMIQQAGGALDRLDDWLSGKLHDADFAARVGVPSVGSAMQDSIEEQRPVIDKLLEAGVQIVGTGVDAAVKSGRRTLCITGKLPSGKKKGDYAPELERLGVELVDTVTKELDFLVLADPTATTAKATKARKLGVRLLSESELVEALEQGEFPGDGQA